MQGKTDRELLELAAKAAGLPAHAIEGELESGVPEWNPLIDDGDALRLAVCLNLSVETYKESNAAYSHSKDTLGVGLSGHHSYQAGEIMKEDFGVDPCAATRRAIVRAAAHLGCQK